MSETQAPVEPWEARPRGRWPEWARTLVALAAAAAVLWAVVQFGTGGVLVAGFGALIGLGYVAAALIGGPVLLTLIAKKLTGVPHTVGAIAGTVISVLLTIVAASHYGQLSMMWVPALGIDVAYPLAGLAGALVWSASVGPWPFRALGALAGVGAVGLAFAVLGSDPLIPAVRVGAPSAEEDFEDFSDSIDDFLSTDAPGTTSRSRDDTVALGASRLQPAQRHLARARRRTSRRRARLATSRGGRLWRCVFHSFFEGPQRSRLWLRCCWCGCGGSGRQQDRRGLVDE
ncbi:hypothetical protein RN607_13840 [Demequina capsici]|uniref:Uncharacterized protein n=1 Tax=Demequina capsici TaxID=3075620 RepID=A0AA96J9G6_9MICO|nr:hypothetical protein [Demequina sp. PMTSA13]WNM27267.1 hypothetical protein RN607_13840 [Demequina sp. PMTSA13]